MLNTEERTAPAVAELLEWHSAKQLPDAEISVLMWVVSGSEREWFAGWWDGDCWRDCASGGVVAGVITHWAEPEGPAA